MLSTQRATCCTSTVEQLNKHMQRSYLADPKHALLLHPARAGRGAAGCSKNNNTVPPGSSEQVPQTFRNH